MGKEFEKRWKNKKGRKARIQESIRDLQKEGVNLSSTNKLQTTATVLDDGSTLVGAHGE